MKFIVNFCRILVGSVFVFSGIVKTIDPKGTEYKLHEYFTLNDSILNIPILAKYALYVAVFFVIFEVILGVLMILGKWKKFTLTAIFITIIFFTFLTYYSAHYKVVTDCGCFGDFLKLEPWTSFYKDVVLLIFILLIIIFHKYYKPIFNSLISNIILIISIITSISIAYVGINHSPIVDFRPFAVGKSIKDGMNNGKEAKIIKFYTLKHTNSKKTKIMSDSIYMASNIWKDTLWVIDTTKTTEKIITPEKKASIRGFAIYTDEGEETEKYLNIKCLALIVFPEDEYCTEGVQRMYNLIHDLDTNKIEILALAAQKDCMQGIRTGTCDDKILKAMSRSTPGLLLISNGIVLAKYHHNDVPNAKEVYKIFKIK